MTPARIAAKNCIDLQSTCISSDTVDGHPNPEPLLSKGEKKVFDPTLSALLDEVYNKGLAPVRTFKRLQRVQTPKRQKRLNDKICAWDLKNGKKLIELTVATINPVKTPPTHPSQSGQFSFESDPLSGLEPMAPPPSKPVPDYEYPKDDHKVKMTFVRARRIFRDNPHMRVSLNKADTSALGWEFPALRTKGSHTTETTQQVSISRIYMRYLCQRDHTEWRSKPKPSVFQSTKKLYAALTSNPYRAANLAFVSSESTDYTCFPTDQFMTYHDVRGWSEYTTSPEFVNQAGEDDISEIQPEISTSDLRNAQGQQMPGDLFTATAEFARFEAALPPQANDFKFQNSELFGFLLKLVYLFRIKKENHFDRALFIGIMAVDYHEQLAVVGGAGLEAWKKLMSSVSERFSKVSGGILSEDSEKKLAGTYVEQGYPLEEAVEKSKLMAITQMLTTAVNSTNLRDVLLIVFGMIGFGYHAISGNEVGFGVMTEAATILSNLTSGSVLDRVLTGANQFMCALGAVNESGLQGFYDWMSPFKGMADMHATALLVSKTAPGWKTMTRAETNVLDEQGVAIRNWLKANRAAVPSLKGSFVSSQYRAILLAGCDFESYRKDYCTTTMLRVMPYVVALIGGSSLGKTSLQARVAQIIMWAAGTEEDVKSLTKRIYYYHSNDQYQSGLTISHQCFILDDVSSVLHSVELASGGSIMPRFIQITNNVPILSNQADLNDKGAITMHPFGVVMSSNDPTLGVHQTFAVPAVVFRRIHQFAHVETATEFSTPDGNLDQKKASAWSDDPANAGKCEPFWAISVLRHNAVNTPMPGGKGAVEISLTKSQIWPPLEGGELVQGPVTYGNSADWFPWLAAQAKAHSDFQRNLINVTLSRDVDFKALFTGGLNGAQEMSKEHDSFRLQAQLDATAPSADGTTLPPNMDLAALLSPPNTTNPPLPSVDASAKEVLIEDERDSKKRVIKKVIPSAAINRIRAHLNGAAGGDGGPVDDESESPGHYYDRMQAGEDLFHEVVSNPWLQCAAYDTEPVFTFPQRPHVPDPDKAFWRRGGQNRYGRRPPAAAESVFFLPEHGPIEDPCVWKTFYRENFEIPWFLRHMPQRMDAEFLSQAGVDLPVDMPPELTQATAENVTLVIDNCWLPTMMAAASLCCTDFFATFGAVVASIGIAMSLASHVGAPETYRRFSEYSDGMWALYAYMLTYYELFDRVGIFFQPVTNLVARTRARVGNGCTYIRNTRPVAATMRVATSARVFAVEQFREVTSGAAYEGAKAFVKRNLFAIKILIAILAFLVTCNIYTVVAPFMKDAYDKCSNYMRPDDEVEALPPAPVTTPLPEEPLPAPEPPIEHQAGIAHKNDGAGSYEYAPGLKPVALSTASRCTAPAEFRARVKMNRVAFTFDGVKDGYKVSAKAHGMFIGHRMCVVNAHSVTERLKLGEWDSVKVTAKYLTKLGRSAAKSAEFISTVQAPIVRSYEQRQDRTDVDEQYARERAHGLGYAEWTQELTRDNLSSNTFVTEDLMFLVSPSGTPRALNDLTEFLVPLLPNTANAFMQTPEWTEGAVTSVSWSHHATITDKYKAAAPSNVTGYTARMHATTVSGDCGQPYLDRVMSVLYGFHAAMNRADTSIKVIQRILPAHVAGAISHFNTAIVAQCAPSVMSNIAELPLLDTAEEIKEVVTALNCEATARFEAAKLHDPDHTTLPSGIQDVPQINKTKDRSPVYWIGDTEHPNYVPLEINGDAFKVFGNVGTGHKSHTNIREDVVYTHLKDTYDPESGLPLDCGKFAPNFSVYAARTSQYYFLSDLATQPKFCPKFATACLFAAESYIWSIMRNKDWPQHMEVLDDHHAINGVPGLKGFEPMNFKTSAGAPFGGPKEKHFDRNADGTRVMKPDLAEKVALATQRLMLGPYYGIYTAAMKDEPLKAAKIAMGKYRIILGAPLPMSVVIRKFFLCIARVMQLFPFTFGAAVGMNASGVQWEQLAKHLGRGDGKGTNWLFCDGDFSGFDKALRKEVTTAVKLIIKAMIKASPNSAQWDPKFVDNILDSLFSPVINLLGLIIQVESMNSSGHNLTTQVNCIANNVLVRFSFFDCFPKAKMSSFDEFMRIITYGDDLLFSTLKIEFSAASMQLSLAKVGIGFTDAEKNKVIMPHRDFDKLDFLKRKFRTVMVDGIGEFAKCPLDLQSIIKMFQWADTSSGITDSDRLLAVMSGAAHETFFHGPEIHNLFRDWVMRAVAQYAYGGDVIYTYPTYEAMAKWYVNGLAPTCMIEDPMWRDSALESLEGKDLSVFEQQAGEDIYEKIAAVAKAGWESLGVDCRDMPNGPFGSSTSVLAECPDLYILEWICQASEGVFTPGSAPQDDWQSARDHAKKCGVDRVHSLATNNNTLTEFTGDGPVRSWGIPAQTDASFDVGSTDQFGLQTWFQRPLKMYSINWTEQTKLDDIPDIWHAYFTHADNRDKLKGYSRMRGSLNVKITINASPMQYGAGIMSYYPLATNAAAKFPGGHTDAAFAAIPDAKLSILTTRPHTWFYPQFSRGCEMNLPFIYYKNWISLDNGGINELNNMGQLTLSSVGLLDSAAQNAVQPVTISIYVWCDDLELAGPSYVMQSGGDVPASRVNLMPNYSAPDSSAQMDKLSLSNSNSVSTDGSTVGLGGSCDMDIAGICNRDVHLVATPWVATKPPESPLLVMQVTPMHSFNLSYLGTKTSKSARMVQMTPACHVGTMFQLWKGEITYRLTVIASQFHRGRLLVSYDPSGSRKDATKAGYVGARTISKVWDIADTPDFEFTVPYMAETGWLDTGGVDAISNPIETWFVNPTLPLTGMTYMPSQYNGTITVSVLNALTSTDPGAAVTLITRVNCQKVQYANPLNIDLPISFYKLQSGDDEGTMANEPDEPIVTSVAVVTASDTDVYVGETVTSLLPLMRRVNRVGPLMCNGFASVKNNSYSAVVPNLTPNGGLRAGIMKWKAVFPLLPVPGGIIPVTGNHNYGALVKGTNAATAADVVENTVLKAPTMTAYISPAYVGWRGSHEYHAKPSYTRANVKVPKAYNNTAFGEGVMQVTDLSLGRNTESYRYRWQSTYTNYLTLIGNYLRQSASAIPSDSTYRGLYKQNSLRTAVSDSAGSAGFSVTSVGVQPVVDAVFPYYSKYRMLPCNPIANYYATYDDSKLPWNLSPSINDTSWSAQGQLDMSIECETWNDSTSPAGSPPWNPYLDQVNDRLPHVDMYHRVGEDFRCFMYLNPPTVHVYTEAKDGYISTWR